MKYYLFSIENEYIIFSLNKKTNKKTHTNNGTKVLKCN